MALRHEQLGFDETDNQIIYEVVSLPSSYEGQEVTRRRLAEERLGGKTTYVENVGYIALAKNKNASPGSQAETA